MDLSPLYEKVQAVEGRAGRPAIDPAILMALWLYATLEAVGSARALDRLCREHHAYQWICGGVSVNYHTLSDFRVQHVEVLDRLLSEGVAALMVEGLVELQRVAQDGMRVRANAGAASFRRESTLQECLSEAEAQVTALRKELEEEPTATSNRQKAARTRASQQRKQQAQAALRQLSERRATERGEDRKTDPPPARPDGDANSSRGPAPDKSEKKKEPRASTTDPQARVMKMADGGFRPAYNTQFAADTASLVIVGVDISNSGSDRGKMLPMLEQMQGRYEQLPQDMLVDGGFAGIADIEGATATPFECDVYAPPMKPKGARSPGQSRRGDTEAIAVWRARMQTPEAKEIYKERAATVECVNAQARNRGLLRFLVRGLEKVRAVVLWHALAHNLACALRLRRVALAAA